MLEVEFTGGYARWFAKLRDEDAKSRIDMRIRRLRQGNFGDAKSVGQGVAELRINYGLGYRVYFMRKGMTVIVLLAGGDKRTQQRDIAHAAKLAAEIGREK